jgi:hypothetical protein
VRVEVLETPNADSKVEVKREIDFHDAPELVDEIAEPCPLARRVHLDCDCALATASHELRHGVRPFPRV